MKAGQLENGREKNAEESKVNVTKDLYCRVDEPHCSEPKQLGRVRQMGSGGEERLSGGGGGPAACGELFASTREGGPGGRLAEASEDTASRMAAITDLFQGAEEGKRWRGSSCVECHWPIVYSTGGERRRRLSMARIRES